MTSGEVVPGEWLERFAEVTWAAVREHWNADCCIAATRVGLLVLEQFGVSARPLAVRYGVFTRAAWESMDLAAGRHARGHSVGTGGTGLVDPVRRRWDGHLVIELVHQPLIVDLSLPQANRPHLGIVVEPAVVPLPEGGLPPLGRQLALAVGQTGQVLVYGRLDCPGRPWEQAPDWAGQVLVYGRLDCPGRPWEQAPDWAGNTISRLAAAAAAVRALQAWV